jgi:hypothetical protein
MKTSLELRVFLKHLPSEYRHAARVAYWIGANDVLKSVRQASAKAFELHEARHPEAGTEDPSGRISRVKKDPFGFHARQVGKTKPKRRVSK